MLATDADLRMVDPTIGEADDERLRHLLAVENRLQDFVRAAQDKATRRIAEARAAREHRLAAARDEAARADAERARVERVGHEEALAAIETAHRAALTTITSLSDERVDDLARWLLARVIARTGEPA